MRFDAVLACASASEMSHALADTRVRKIQQLSRDIFLFTLWGRGEQRFLVSLAPGVARMHLVKGEYGHAETPSAFCMLLRKSLEGARFCSAFSPGMERMICLDFAYADGGTRRLAVELLPSRRSLVLIDERGAVIADLSRHRRKGDPFEIPVSEKPPAMLLPGDALLEALRLRAPLESGVALDRALVASCFGIGTSYARRILASAELDPDLSLSGLLVSSEQQAALAHAWDAFWQPLIAGDLTSLQRGFRTLGEMLEDAFSTGRLEATLQQERQALAQRVGRRRERIVRRLEAQEDDLRKAHDAEKHRHYGDLLIANLYRVERRASSVTVEDYENNMAAVEIPLDPDLSPQDNAQRYYQRYKKARRGEQAIAEAMRRTRQDLEYADNLLVAIETAVDRNELREIVADLQADPLQTGKRAAGKGKGRKRLRTPASRPRRYRTEGWELLVGRNPRQNEQVSLKLAGSNDLWFHARQIAGAHVVLRPTGGGGEPPEALLVAAARLAACFSQSAHDTRVAVDFTKVRYLKKPPGTPPGYVTYSREKTITVEPDMEAALKVVQPL